jgi:N-methylhydantoinase B/oxoprolinase/acetone carboxylase alpha subunit
VFELEAMNELAQRENEELKRDMDKKIRQLEEQLSTSERVIGDLKVQCNDGRQRLKKATDEYSDLKKAYDDLMAKCERETRKKMLKKIDSLTNYEKNSHRFLRTHKLQNLSWPT